MAHGIYTKAIESFSRVGGLLTGQIFVEWNGVCLRFRVLAHADYGAYDKTFDRYFVDIENAREYAQVLK